MTSYNNLISVDELKHQLNNPSWHVVDCRFDLMKPSKGYAEYQQDHIPGAQYANLNQDLSGLITKATGRHPLPKVETFAKRLSTWGIGNESQVVVYDHASGAIAARLWWMLRWLGHTNVAVLDGGYDAWKKSAYATFGGNEAVVKTSFQALPNSGMIISTDELQKLLISDEAPIIVDARDRIRYTGKNEPIDTVAGHIPGTVNHPFLKGINADGSWKRKKELKASWDTVFKGSKDKSWISMCGSGVTACHLILSAQLAGIPNPRLYVGSWSEWILDPNRPIVTDEI
jgi:thiosulfate/3-mercaptopyruvate sulfurtransferase